MAEGREVVNVYQGTRVGRWLRQPVKVRLMLLIAVVLLVASRETWLPRAVQGLMVLVGLVLLSWNLWLDRPRGRRHA